jgi:hypothetical protein
MVLVLHLSFDEEVTLPMRAFQYDVNDVFITFVFAGKGFAGEGFESHFICRAVVR